MQELYLSFGNSETEGRTNVFQKYGSFPVVVRGRTQGSPLKLKHIFYLFISILMFF
jgi:hypothetical protein